LACIVVPQASDTVGTAAALGMGDAAAGKAAASDAAAIDIAGAAGGQAGTWQGAYDAAAANSCAGDAAAWWRLLLYKLFRRLPLPSPRTQVRYLTRISKLSVIDRNPHSICVLLELDLHTTCI